MLYYTRNFLCSQGSWWQVENTCINFDLLFMDSVKINGPSPSSSKVSVVFSSYFGALSLMKKFIKSKLNLAFKTRHSLTLDVIVMGCLCGTSPHVCSDYFAIHRSVDPAGSSGRAGNCERVYMSGCTSSCTQIYHTRHRKLSITIAELVDLRLDINLLSLPTQEWSSDIKIQWKIPYFSPLTITRS